MKNGVKILVCSVNAWNGKVGDDTFSRILSDLDKTDIASIFIREETPDFSLCENYFRISENKIIKSVFNRRTVTGARVNAEDETHENAIYKQQNRYKNHEKGRYFKLFVRDIIWKVGKWKSKALNDFLAEFNPQIILYEMSGYPHLNRIIRYAIKKTGAKGIGWFCDDNFTYKQSQRLGYKMFRTVQKKSLKKLVKDTSAFFAVIEKTKREADEVFNINCGILTKPFKPLTEEFTEYSASDPISVLYTGNLGVGRLETLKTVADAVSENKSFRLDVYTNTYLSEKEKSYFNKERVKLYPAVCQKDVLSLQRAADILLFAESVKENEKTARLSFSTKITDYYAAGKCILAMGNIDLAPIEELKTNDCAIVVTNEKELKEKLSEIENNRRIISVYAEKAFERGKNFHDEKTIKERFFNTVYKIKG